MFPERFYHSFVLAFSNDPYALYNELNASRVVVGPESKCVHFVCSRGLRARKLAVRPREQTKCSHLWPRPCYWRAWAECHGAANRPATTRYPVVRNSLSGGPPQQAVSHGTTFAHKRRSCVVTSPTERENTTVRHQRTICIMAAHKAITVDWDVQSSLQTILDQLLVEPVARPIDPETGEGVFL